MAQLRRASVLLRMHHPAKKHLPKEHTFISPYDYLITGETDLLVLKEFEKTKIVSLSDFEIIHH